MWRRMEARGAVSSHLLRLQSSSFRVTPCVTILSRHRNTRLVPATRSISPTRRRPTTIWRRDLQTGTSLSRARPHMRIILAGPIRGTSPARSDMERVPRPHSRQSQRPGMPEQIQTNFLYAGGARLSFFSHGPQRSPSSCAGLYVVCSFTLHCVQTAQGTIMHAPICEGEPKPA
jgi:hypothetical protein